MVRHADPERDAAACAAIYAPNVEPGLASFEDEAPGAAEMAERIAPPRAATRGWWRSATAAWRATPTAPSTAPAPATAGRSTSPSTSTRPSTAAASAASSTTRCSPLLARQRLHVACAGITLPNDASVGLHEAVGFEPVGVYRDIGFKHGAWRSVGWWQRRLVPPETPPREPLGPQRL